jgi:1-phosphofructokinase family hexose kinase
MPKIITITCHTALDYRLELDKLIPGKTLIADHSVSYSGGKGINVAKAVTSLDIPAHVLGFVGAQSINRFTLLENDLFTADYTIVDGTTRTNLTLNDNTSETHIRTHGFSVSETDCERLCQSLVNCIEAGDIVAISGSLPPGAPDDFLQSLVTLCHQYKAWPMLDSNGAGLKFGILAHPGLCKPNLDELAELSGKPFNTIPSIIDAGKDLIDSGCPAVVMSRGKYGVIAINSKNILSVSVDSINTLIQSTIGCGDALVAGMAIGCLQNLEFTEMLRLGLACASANLASAEPGIITPDLVDQYKNLVLIDSI